MATARVIIPQEWRQGERDFQEVIPKAITLFHETEKHEEKVDVLTFLCTALLPKLPQTRLEDALLCHMFPHLPLYVEKIFTEIDDIVHPDSQVDQNTSSNNLQTLHDLLPVVLSVLNCIEACMKHICETFQHINIHQVHSLPVPVLMIVKSAFCHCQKSEASYGELFNSVSQDLSQLFKKSFELQKLLMELMCVKIEALTNSCSDEDLQSITSVCDHLLDICDIAERFDGNMTPGVWKSLIRLVMKNKGVIKNHLQNDRVVSQMCVALEVRLKNYENLINNKDDTERNPTSESSSMKLLKALKFLIKLLMSFLQSFQDFLVPSTFMNIIAFIYSVISVSTTSLTKDSTGSKASEDNKTSLIIVVEPFLKMMVSNRKFADALTHLNQETDSKDSFSRCYTLANIVILLPVLSDEVSLYWIKPNNYSEEETRLPVYEALLGSCDSCFVEMSIPLQLPGTMCNGKPQRMVSMYEYVVSRLSASISAISSQHFHIVEKILLKSVFDGQNISASIATDVWCFMASTDEDPSLRIESSAIINLRGVSTKLNKWMTADLCYNHVKLFLHWLSRVSWKSDIQKNRLRTLTRRLLPLVAQEHQELLVQDYPPDRLNNLEVWSVIPVRKMVDSVQTQVATTIVHFSKSVLQKCIDQSVPQSDLEKHLKCLQNLVSHSVILDRLPKDSKSEFIHVAICLFDAFMDSPKKISEFCWVKFLDILKLILPLLQEENFHKVLNHVAKGVDLFKDDILNLYFARLMSQCGKLSFPIGQSESALISKIFRALITSNQWLVHNEAFTALRKFAEVTPYTPVLEDCVPGEMKEDFQKFICGIPYGGCEAEDQDALLQKELREQATIQRPEKNCSSEEMIASANGINEKELDKRKREGSDGENDAKRTKIEIHQISREEEQLLSTTLENLSDALFKLQEIYNHNPQFPPDAREKLKSMKILLDTIVNSD